MEFEKYVNLFLLRTVLEDALVEGKVGMDYTDAAVTIATEYLSSYKAVQLGLAAEEAVMGLVEANLPIPAILPTISKIRRSARAAKRAGAKHIEVVRWVPLPPHLFSCPSGPSPPW